MSEPELIIERDEAVVTLTLNRPAAMNALSPQLIADLCQAFASLQQDNQVKVVILT